VKQLTDGKKTRPIVRANPQPIPVGFSHRAARRPVNGFRAIFEAEIDLKRAHVHDLTGLPGSVLLFASVEIDLAAWASVPGRDPVNRLGRPSR
jgi:hypothetical protein